MKKYEAEYAGYVYPKQNVEWATEERVKEALSECDFAKKNVHGGGLPIISDGKKCYADTGDGHTAICAISGMKKTLCCFMPLIYSLMKAGENMLITDPKGEIYERMSGELKKAGYNVRCLDFKTFDKDGYNVLEYPAKVYRSGNKNRGALMLNDLIAVLSAAQRDKTNDLYWSDTAKMWLNGTGMLMLDAYPDFSSINILNWNEFNRSEIASNLGRFFSKYPSGNTAIQNILSVADEPDKTLSCTLSTVSGILSPFIQNDSLLEMMSESTFELGEFLEPKTALFLIIDDTTTTCDTVVAMIVSQIQSFLVSEAAKFPGGKLPVRMNFVLDEFANFPFVDIDRALATHRSRGIRYYICIQSLSGLRVRYPNFEALLANCDTQVFLGSTERELLDRIAYQCGVTDVTSDGSTRYLASPSELMNLEKDYYYKEAVYMNLSTGIRFCSKLPAIEKYFERRYAPPRITHQKREIKKYSVSEFLADVSARNIRKPFSN